MASRVKKKHSSDYDPDGYAGDTSYADSDYAPDSPYASSEHDYQDISVSLQSQLSMRSQLSMQTQLSLESQLSRQTQVSLQTTLILETQLEMIDDNHPSGRFFWHRIAGWLIGISATIGGIVVIVATGGGAAPVASAIMSLLGTTLASAGTAGIIYCASTNSDTFEWDVYMTEMLVDAAITLGTMGASKLAAVAKGVKKAKDLSKVTRVISDAVSTTALRACENEIRNRPVETDLYKHFLSSLLGHALAKKAPQAVGARNRQIFMRAFAEHIEGIVGGAVGGAASNTLENAIYGRNLFANFWDAVKIGARNGAISGATRAVTVTALIKQNRRFHNVQLLLAQDAVGNDKPCTQFTLEMYLHHTGDIAILFDSSINMWHTYGSGDSGVIHPIQYIPGNNGNIGHYQRIDPRTMKPVKPTRDHGVNGCLVEALQATPQQLLDALNVKTQRSLASSRDIESLYDQNLGGAKKQKRALVQAHSEKEKARASALKVAQEHGIVPVIDHNNKHMKFVTTNASGKALFAASQFQFDSDVKGAQTLQYRDAQRHWAYMVQFAASQLGLRLPSGTQVVDFDFIIGKSNDKKTSLLVYDYNHGYPSDQLPKQIKWKDVPTLSRQTFAHYIGENMGRYMIYVSTLEQATSIQDRRLASEALAFFSEMYMPD